MIAVDAPIHTGTINGKSVRFFKGPTDAPDMPWHAHDDLLSALGVPRDLRRRLRADMLRGFADVCRTVEVAGEPVLLAPHYVAQGLIGAAEQAGQGIARDPHIVSRDYTSSGLKAMSALTVGLTEMESFKFAIDAFRNSGTAGDAP